MQPSISLPPGPKPGRHLKEKHRRQQMSRLYHQLASVISHENSQRNSSSSFDVLDQATNHINQLEKNVNELKARKDSLQLPVVIRVNESERGESLEINIVYGSENKKMKMRKVFRILEEEGGEVVSASKSIVGLKIYHTILCKAFSPRIGMDTNRAQERLKNFISGT